MTQQAVNQTEERLRGIIDSLVERAELPSRARHAALWDLLTEKLDERVPLSPSDGAECVRRAKQIASELPIHSEQIPDRDRDSSKETSRPVHGAETPERRDRRRARLAAIQPAVNAFRRDLLDGDTHAQQDTSPPCSSAADAGRWIYERIAQEPPRSFNEEVMFGYQTARGCYTTVAAQTGTAVARLGTTALALAIATGFDARQLATYLLVGKPLPELLKVTVGHRDERFPPGARDPLMHRRRIRIDLDAGDVTYKQFRALYCTIRSQLKLTHRRAVSEKLAWLMAQVKKPPPNSYDPNYWGRVSKRDPWKRKWKALAEAYSREIARRKARRA